MLLIEWLPAREATLPHAMAARSVQVGRLRLSLSRHSLESAGQAALREAYTDRTWSSWSLSPGTDAAAPVLLRSWMIAAERAPRGACRTAVAGDTEAKAPRASRLRLGPLLLTFAPITVSGLTVRGEAGELLLAGLLRELAA